MPDLRSRWLRLLGLVSVLALSTPACAQLRSEVLLSGQWEYQKLPAGAELTYPPPAGGWQPTTVPGYLSGTNYERAWFRRSIGIPKIAAGKRLKLRFLGVKYNSVVYVNGQEVGRHFGGHEMFDVDITKAVKLGERNDILLGVHDWTGLFNRRVDLAGDWEGLRSAPRDAILAPIGGMYHLYGIWDDVYLLALPEFHIADVFVKPSVRQGTITVDLELANESSAFAQVTVSSRVLGPSAAGRPQGGTVVVELPERQIKCPAGEAPLVTTSAAAKGLEFWWPDSPKLYTLRTTLSQGGRVIDTVDTRFGYRELWAEKQWFVLNGERVILRASSWWPPGSTQTREQVAATIQALKVGNNICFRTHTQPWPHLWYEVADELGLLMVPEGGVWNDDEVYRINDPAFWDNYADHLRRMVRQHRNHPSIVIWSLENEFYGSRLNDESPAKADLVRMGRMMKELDPTRLITYESDLDPGGVADVVGLHYPHEYPEYQLYPDTCYWMDQPQNMQGRAFTEGRPLWKWNRNKPLYIGEFLWVPSSDPSWHTIFFGDDAYLDYEGYRNRAKAESWKMQIEAYRWYRVSGICPWTEGEGGPLNEKENRLYAAQKWAFQPIAAYCREYDARFYAGESVERTLAIYNDVPRSSSLLLEWQLGQGGQAIQKDSRRLDLAAAEKRVVTVALSIPLVEQRTRLDFHMAIFRGQEAKPAFEETKTYWAFPRNKLPDMGQVRVALYDLNGATGQVLRSAGVQFERLGSLDAPPAADVLVIGARTLKKAGRGIPVIGVEEAGQFALADFVDKGGRLLVLEQDEYPESLLPVSQTNHAATMAFPQVTGHPILSGVQPEDLKWWRGDHLVSENDLARPVSGGCRPVVVSGGAEGIGFCPLLELPRGQGTMVLSQLKLIRKFEQEPAARLILGNCLHYLAGFRPSARPTQVIGEEGFWRQLDGLGLEYQQVSFAQEPALKEGGLLIHQGPVEPLLGLRLALDQFVQNGGTLLLHRLSPQGLEALRGLLGADLRLTPNASPISKQGQDPILDLVTREDLYWLGQQQGASWSTTPLATNVADYTFTKTFAGQREQTFQAKAMELKGQIVQALDEGVGLFTVGSVSQEVDFGQGGPYIVGARMRGSVAQGIWPNAQFSVDGQAIGIVGILDDQWRDYATFGDVPTGRHTLSVAFINDGSGPGEDRNLFVDRVFVARDTQPLTGVQFLTSPAALVRIPKGKGAIIIDQVNWDTEQANATKARRYACALLTALGATFRHRPSVALEAEDMQPVGQIAWFRREPTGLYLGSVGSVEGQVRCAKAGDYELSIVARGTPAAGEYPLIKVQLDGKDVGSVQLTGGGWQGYPLKVAFTEGDHKLTLTFANDLFQAPEDRNLWLDKVEFRRAA